MLNIEIISHRCCPSSGSCCQTSGEGDASDLLCPNPFLTFARVQQDAARLVTSAIPRDAVQPVPTAAKEILAAPPTRRAAAVEGAVTLGTSRG